MRIAKRRQALRMTQGELAAKLGVSKSSVANWESGKHFPKRKLGLVEAVLGVSLDDEESEEPELPPEMMASVDRVLPPGDPRRQAVIDMLRQALADTSAGVPAPAEPGRHRRRAAG